MTVQKSYKQPLLIIFLLLASILIASCTQAAPVSTCLMPLEETMAVPTTLSQDAAQAIVEQMVTAKLEAMQAKDIDQYLALIHKNDREYYTEQRNWFRIYQDAVTSDFTIDVQKVRVVNDSTLVASLKQHYLYGPEKDDRTVSYDERYIQTPDGWKDADLNFEAGQTAHFLIKYPRKAASNAADVCEEAEQAYASVVKGLQLEPAGKVTIKLYDDKEILRQSSDIRVAYLFSGWNEDGESIKLYARRDRGTFAPLVAHELTHKITLGISDSLNSWLAEGLATYFGNQPYQGGNVLEKNSVTLEQLTKPISWLEETNLIELTDGEAIKVYYGMSSMVVEFMVKTYGLDRLKAILQELSKNPRYDRGYDYGQMELENNKRLHQAIETVLGIDMETFNQQWLDWIKSQE